MSEYPVLIRHRDFGLAWLLVCTVFVLHVWDEAAQTRAKYGLGKYWRIDKMKSFDEFLEKRFPDSRRKAYCLMAIHENLARVPKQQLREIGWSKATELVKIARREGERFESATWVHKAQELPKEEFKREVERHLTGRERERWELLYFKLYKSQLKVIEQALETPSLMLRSDKSRGYCLEMISADFLAGVKLENGIQKPCCWQFIG